MEQQGRADVAVELREAILLAEIGVPDPECLMQRELPCQEAGNPPIGKVLEGDLLLLEVLAQLLVDVRDQVLHVGNGHLNARLHVSEVV